MSQNFKNEVMSEITELQKVKNIHTEKALDEYMLANPFKKGKGKKVPPDMGPMKPGAANIGFMSDSERPKTFFNYDDENKSPNIGGNAGQKQHAAIEEMKEDLHSTSWDDNSHAKSDYGEYHEKMLKELIHDINGNSDEDN